LSFELVSVKNLFTLCYRLSAILKDEMTALAVRLGKWWHRLIQ